MRLTKEQAITEHRKMWNWIVTELLEHTIEQLCDEYLDLDHVKQRYLQETHGYENKDRIYKHCYCCEYAKQIAGTPYGRCMYCPVDFPGDKVLYRCQVKSGIYGLAEECFMVMMRRMDNKNLINREVLAMESKGECISLCEQIANLPEREIPCV